VTGLNGKKVSSRIFLILDVKDGTSSP